MPSANHRTAPPAPDPLVTVVVPVFNREAGLRRALASIEAQTYREFECLVVDDGSSVDLSHVVGELGDDRFRFLRRGENRGPCSVRRLGYEAMRGELLTGLDSDDVALPQMLASGVAHLGRHPDVAGVAGMIGSGPELRRRVIVAAGERVMTPAEYCRSTPVPDCIPMVRREAVTEWLAKRDDYFAFEAHLWFTFHHLHSMLFVDDVWVQVDLGGSDRVSAGVDPRALDDLLVFVEEHADYLGLPCVPLDRLVADGWFALRSAGRAGDASRLEAIMRARGISRAGTYRRRATEKVLRRLRGDRVHVI